MEHFEAKQSPRAEFTARCFNTSACNPGAALQCCVPQNPCPLSPGVHSPRAGAGTHLGPARCSTGSWRGAGWCPTARWEGGEASDCLGHTRDRQTASAAALHSPSRLQSPIPAPPSTPEHPAQRMVATVRRTTASGHFRPGQAPW